MTNLIEIWCVDGSYLEDVPYFKVTSNFHVLKNFTELKFLLCFHKVYLKWHDIFDLCFAGTCN